MSSTIVTTKGYSTPVITGTGCVRNVFSSVIIMESEDVHTENSTVLSNMNSCSSSSRVVKVGYHQ